MLFLSADRTQQGNVKTFDAPPPLRHRALPVWQRRLRSRAPHGAHHGSSPQQTTPTSMIHVERRKSVKAGRVAPLRGVELGFTNNSDSWWNLDEKTSFPPSINTPLGSVLPADLRRHLPPRGPLHNLHQHFRHVWRSRRVQPLGPRAGAEQPLDRAAQQFPPGH